jgi:TetR/AcrR family transcriptional repressor of nem operon
MVLLMARAKEFERDVVLEKAMNFFWSHGYEASSMRDLLEEMEIGRQSLYDTFGDKHSLFLASLRHYYEMGIGSVVAALSAPDGGLSAIENYFEGMARRMSRKPYRSCLLINSAIELAPHDPEVAAIVNRFVKNLRKAFVQALKVAEAKGEARIDDVDAVAWHLTNSAMGLGPMSKARVPYKDLKRVSEQILKNIRA